MNFELHICEEEKPETLGIVVDITEGGFGLKGIEAIIGESKNFAIPADEFFDVAQVEFQARCCWVNREESTVNAFQDSRSLAFPQEAWLSCENWFN